jgi:tetratricopeptide (TPR) repeat protein
MSPAEVLERLADRFRLLAGSRRGVERHQTLRHAVGWSFDLLNGDERAVLSCGAVFADGFDLESAWQICGAGLDEYVVLDLLDSLVRKSLITVEHVGGHTRYGMLETIRQYAEDQLADSSNEVRDRHASYFAEQAVAHWEIWDGPRQRVALDWVDVELANLRAGFRWAADGADLVSATAIAAHTAPLAQTLQRYEPVGWAEELLAAASAADVDQLPRLYLAASLCAYLGRPADALAYAQTALRLEAQPGYDSFQSGWGRFYEALALRFSGEVEEGLEICEGMASQTGFERLLGLTLVLYILPNAGRSEEARAIAEETATAVRAHGNPWLIAFALDGYGRAFAETDPVRALTVLRQGLDYTRDHRLPLFEAFFARDVAALEAAHGERDEALALFDDNIDSLHRAGDVAHLSSTLANLAAFFDRIDQPDIAATVYGTTIRHASITRVINLSFVVDHLRDVLGQTRFDQCLAAGAAMAPADAVHYVRRHIHLARRAEDRRRPDRTGVQDHHEHDDATPG